MLTVPTWLIIVLSAVCTFIGLIVGVILCYSKTPRIGDIILTPDPDSKDIYLFLELNKPLEQMGEALSDGKEVLATIRVKNTQ